MFPLRDSERTRSKPWMTRAIALFTVAVFVYQLVLPPDVERRVIEACGLVPARWSAAPLAPVEWWPFVTSVFLHGSFLHLLFNLWALWIFGDNIEERLGRGRYLCFYVACGVFAGALHVASDPRSPIPTIGASGAIAGVMGAYFVVHPRARVVTMLPLPFPLIFQVPAYVYLGAWFLIQLWSGARALGLSGEASIAWWAHIGGFLGGMLGVRLFTPRARRERVSGAAPGAWP